jgi:hypothetical protein
MELTKCEKQPDDDQDLIISGYNLLNHKSHSEYRGPQ